MATTVNIEFTGGASADRLAQSVEGLRDRINGLGDHSLMTAEAILELVDRLEAAADQIISLTSESEALERNAQRLSLDFNEAADAAGRFTDETDVMATATRFAEAGIRLTQEELNNLTRAGAQFSQNTGQPMAAVMQQIADGTLNGTEALRRFGPDLAALQGPAHTVNERLAAMVRHAQALPQATDDAASSLARLRDTFGDAQREMARGFSEQIGQAMELGSVVRALGGDLEDTGQTMRAIGRAAADVVSAVVNTVSSVVLMVGIAGAAVNDALHGRGFAGGEDSRQMYALFLSRANAVTAAVDRLGSGGDGGGAPSAPAAVSAAGSSMTFTEQEARDAETDTAARNRRGPSSGGERGMTNEQRVRAAEAAQDAYQRQLELEAKARQAAAEAANEGNYDRREQVRQQAAEANRLADERDAAREEEGKARRAASEAEIERNLRAADIGVALFDRQRDAALAFREAVVSTYDDATEALGTYLGALLSGEEASAQAVLTAIDRKAQQVAGESAIQALQATAEGIYYSITAPPIAATKFLAAAKFGALALGAGLTAAAIPNAPAAGGGGRGGGAAAAPARLDPGGGSGSGGPTIVNINVTSGVASTPRDTARAVRRVLGDGAALTGIGLPANVLGGM